MKLNLVFFLISIFISLISINTIKASSVEGRIVDKQGKPIPKANILLYPPKEENGISYGEIDYNMIHLVADDDGKFSFTPEFREFLLCSTYPSKNQVFTPFPINYGCKKDNSKLIKIDEKQSLDLGDIFVSYNFQKVIIKSKKQSFFLGSKDLNITIKLSDENKNLEEMIFDAKLEVDVYQKHFLTLFLPEGTWKIQNAKTKNKKNLSHPVIIKVNKLDNFNIENKDIVIEFVAG